MSSPNNLIKALFTLVLLSAFLLQACGAQPPTPQATQPVTSTETPAQPEYPAPTTPPQEPTPAAVGRRGVLRVATQPLVQVDPAMISSDPEVFAANHIYDYLVDVTPENTIAPRLAKSWTMSEDGLTYVFQLEEGVTFHDGSPLTAKDVVWTFNRLRNPDSGYPTADLYANIESIEATGDLEVTFKLKQSNPFFLFDLSDNHALILKENTQDATKFNGTGPFKVVEYSPEDRLILEANENYFVEGQPKLEGVEILFFADQTAMVDALRGGQVDLVMALSTDLYSSLKGESGITLLDAPTNQFDVVRLRSDRAPGKDPRVMQALKLGLDREAIYQLVMAGFGRIGRDSPIGPMYTTYYSEETPLPARDIEAAKKLLAEAGYPDGLKLDLHTPDTGDRPELAVVLKNQWADIGVDINVIVEPESVYYGDQGWLEVDLGITGWGSRPYPQFYLDVMLKCNAKWNESHFCDQEFDRLATIAGTTLDEAERIAAYKEIQKLLIERGPIIVPYFYTQLAAIRSTFQGFVLKSFSGRSDLRPVALVE
ncbi:MAG: ABC transporter substrate-binding protein [Anaerolineales bacterium]|nr:ABC transporter substrate-binding protein [Anaerolineales bacterium]MDW8447233.1 ABC transporter substrate-binding protein [Anaerolineales bacterium]